MNKRWKALTEVQEKGFAAFEWNLYLDTHQDDVQAQLAFKRAVNEYKAARECYVNEFGPLVFTDTACSQQWTADPWPWDYEGCGC